MQWIPVVLVAIELVVIWYLVRFLLLSLAELREKYMSALQQLSRSSVERFDLIRRLEKYEPAPQSEVQQLIIDLTKKEH